MSAHSRSSSDCDRVPLVDELLEAIHAGALASLPTPGPSGPVELQGFYSLMREFLSRRGKGARGLLSCYTALAFGARLSDAMPVAIALELFQAGVLIHDDILDSSELRRGRAALHVQVGIPVALNVGDALIDFSVAELVRRDMPTGVSDEFVKMMRTTFEGQHIELQWRSDPDRMPTIPELHAMIARKGAYYTAVSPLRLGALVAGEVPPEEFDEGGNLLGIAYQLRDDILNLAGDEAVYGKEVGGDLMEGKPTVLLAHFFSSADDNTVMRARQVLSSPRATKALEDVEWLRGCIISSGAVQRAQAEAEQMSTEGLALVSRGFRSAGCVDSVEAALQVLRGYASRSR